MRKLIFVMAMTVGTVAQAQDAPRPMLSPACRTELQNLCPPTDDRDARRACMASKRDSLSQTCKDEVAAMMKARRERGGGMGGGMGRPEGGPDGGPPHGDMGGMNGGGMGGDQGNEGSPQ